MLGDRLPPRRDALASLVVFLVALPLCMGVAMASGVPPALGLVTGIVGGLVVGTLAGSPLQVSGPAAGLAVLVWDLVNTYGLGALGVAVLVAGLIQVAAGVGKLGRWFRAVSPPVIQGMLDAQPPPPAGMGQKRGNWSAWSAGIPSGMPN